MPDDDLEARVRALEEAVRHMQALAKGEKGDAGKDGRDGRDAKSISAARVVAALRSVSAPTRAPTFVNFDPHITVQPADVQVKSPDVHVAAPSVHVAAPQVHVAPRIDAHVRPSRTVTRHRRDEHGEIIESIADHSET